MHRDRRHRDRPTAKTAPAAVVVALALFAAGCGDDGGATGGDPTTTTGDRATTTTTTAGDPSTTSASQTSTTAAGQDVAPASVDPEWQRYDERWLVTGVEQGDVLNVRQAPGADQPIVDELAPTADDVVLFDAVEWVEGARWGAVAVPGGAGWVNLAFLRPPGSNPPAVQGTVNPRTETAADDIQASLGIADHQRLASFVDERGVVISHDAFVAEDDPVLSAEQILGAEADDTVVLWGTTDGEGAPIEMTIAERLSQIGRDYALASTDVIGFDTRIGSGNTIDNIDERFPGGSVVEYHFDGTSLYGEFDWSSVRFVFDTSVEGRPTLLAIVQDTWTI